MSRRWPRDKTPEKTREQSRVLALAMLHDMFWPLGRAKQATSFSQWEKQTKLRLKGAELLVKLSGVTMRAGFTGKAGPLADDDSQFKDLMARLYPMPAEERAAEIRELVEQKQIDEAFAEQLMAGFLVSDEEDSGKGRDAGEEA